MALTRIGKVTLDGEEFELGGNGDIHLVRNTKDAWGNDRGEVVDLVAWLALGKGTVRRAQLILNLLGETTSRLQQHRDARLDVSGEDKRVKSTG